MSWLPFGLGGSGDQQQRQSSSTTFDNAAGRRRCIRLCTLNAYLIPSAFVNKDNATCTHQTERAERMGQWLRGHNIDIAVLQEVWGGGQPALEASINDASATAAVDGAAESSPPGGRRRRPANPLVADGAPVAVGGRKHVSCSVEMRQSSAGAMSPEEEAARETYKVLPWCGSWGLSFVDAAWQFAAGRGGLWLGHRTGSSQCSVGDAPLGVRWMRYTRSKTSSRKGAVAARFRTFTTDGRPTSLIVVNTHVDPMNTDGVIEHQFGELLEFLREAVLGAKGLLAPSTDGFGGDTDVPPLVGGGLDCAVVLCGDLNTDPESALGKRLLERARGSVLDAPSVVRDLYAEFRGWLPREPTYDCKRNSLVMWPQQERLDWVLSFDRLFGVPLRAVSVRDAKVHEHAGYTPPAGAAVAATDGAGSQEALPHEQRPFSDHWPVTVDLEL